MRSKVQMLPFLEKTNLSFDTSNMLKHVKTCQKIQSLILTMFACFDLPFKTVSDNIKEIYYTKKLSQNYSALFDR